jgi:hypothetical protein
MTGFDLASFDLAKDAEAGAECVLRNPVTGEETDAAITVLGTDAPAYRKAMRAYRDAVLKRRAAAMDGVVSQEAAEFMASVTLGWRGVMLDGKDLPFNRDNAVKLYIHPRCGWVIEQLEAFQTNRGNFTT